MIFHTGTKQNKSRIKTAGNLLLHKVMKNYLIGGNFCRSDLNKVYGSESSLSLPHKDDPKYYISYSHSSNNTCISKRTRLTEIQFLPLLSQHKH